MNCKSLFWKVPLAVFGIVIGLVMLLLVTVTCVLYVPALRAKATEKGLAIAREQTGMDIDVGQLYLSPFHHSPMVLYRAWKGKADLPLEVNIDSLFIGHRGQDTLLYARTLRLRATALTKSEITNHKPEITNIPIVVDELRLESTTFHSDSMIAAVGIDAIVGHLYVTSPDLNIAQGRYPLHGLRLSDTYVGIDLRDTPPDTTAQDTTSMLMAFDIPDGRISRFRFALNPLGLDIRTDTLAVNVLADVGGNSYDARRIDIGATTFAIGDFSLPIDTLYGDACVILNRNLITSQGLHVRSDEIGAQAHLSATEMNLETMRVDVACDADFQGSKALLSGFYDIDDEAYAMHVDVEKVNLSPFLSDSIHAVLACEIDAEGRGIDPNQPMRSAIRMHLTECIYEDFDFSDLDLAFNTDSSTSLNVITKGLKADIQSPMPVFRLIDKIQPLLAVVSDSSVITSITSLTDLTQLDTLRRLIPALRARIDLSHGSPVQHLIDDTGLDIEKVDLTLNSDSEQTDLALGAKLPAISHPEDSTAFRLPAAKAALRVKMTEGQTNASLTADSRLTDGAMSMHNLSTDADFRLDLNREGRNLYGDGQLTLDSIHYDNKNLGTHAIYMQIAPSSLYANALRLGIRLDDIPIELVNSFVTLTDINLEGAIRASASVDGLPYKTDISAEVLPLNISARYKPYNVRLSLGETPIIMNHNHVDFNGLPIYGTDSTFLALTGGLDLNSMRLDVALAADSFAPAKLDKEGPIPVYGELATDIRGNVTGPLDSIIADVDVTILPNTDITYPIDKKNLAQVKPHGTVNVRYETASGKLDLGGRINVDDGFIRYSPKAYPIMPFHVDSGSHVAFNGPVGQTLLNVSASQKVKADVQAEDEETRRVDFITGVRVNGVVDSIGLNTIGFFLEAPEDEAITHELASLDEDTREGLAATLLATGMYMGESNVAAQRGGYALSSIVNSRINAAMANSKMGKIVDIDLSSAQTEHAGGKTNDLNIAISKSFFKDRLRVTVGSTFTDNPEVNQASGLLNNLSAEFKLTPKGNVALRAFAQRDYNNIFEGDLYKSGLGVRAKQEWRKTQLMNSKSQTAGDSITRVYSLMADADVAWRSNNSLGPNLTLTHSIKNLLGKGETFTVKGNGAYYWALRNRHPGDPKKTDTYKLGVTTSLVFPYLHWLGEHNPEGDTRYMLGYQYENIAGGYGIHKVSGSFTYFIKSSRYVTHAFTPFSLSVVRVKAESDSLLNKAAEYPQLIKVLASNEFVPSIGYSFIYNDYRAKRAVNTMFEIGVKESGNLINAIYCIFGHKWNELNKPLGSITFNQFVKMNVELRNKFNLTDKVCFATRLFAGANMPLGNSEYAPLSEAFYAGGPNGMRAASPYAYGPGNFYSEKYNQNFFHAGDIKLEANFELRFPIVWKLFGAAFLDAGNVWNWYSAASLFQQAGMADYIEQLQLRGELYDGIIDNPYFAKQIALGTGTGLRLDLDGLVIRLDLGVGIHAPYQTYKYDKERKPDYTKPITTYFNIPSALDALRLNFGIGYPF